MSEIAKRRPSWRKKEWIEFAELQTAEIERLNKKFDFNGALSETVVRQQARIEKLAEWLADEKCSTPEAVMKSLDNLDQ